VVCPQIYVWPDKVGGSRFAHGAWASSGDALDDLVSAHLNDGWSADAAVTGRPGKRRQMQVKVSLVGSSHWVRPNCPVVGGLTPGPPQHMTRNYYEQDEPKIKPYELPHMKKHQCVLIHCEKGFKKSVLPPLEPDGKTSSWYRASWF